MSQLNALRDFGTPTGMPSAETSHIPEQAAWKRGYAAGRHEAMSHELLALSRQRCDLQHQLLTEIQAARATVTAARHRATAEAAQLLDAVAQLLLPDLAQGMFLQVLKDCLHEAVDHTAAFGCTLHVHPDNADVAAELLQATSIEHVALLQDATLTPGGCEIHMDNTAAHISPDRLCAELLSRLQSALSLHQKEAVHG